MFEQIQYQFDPKGSFPREIIYRQWKNKVQVCPREETLSIPQHIRRQTEKTLIDGTSSREALPRVQFCVTRVHSACLHSGLFPGSDEAACEPLATPSQRSPDGMFIIHSLLSFDLMEQSVCLNLNQFSEENL